jgi:hypothetical protein
MTATAALTAIFGADTAAKIPFPVIAATKPYYLGMAYWSKTKKFRVAFVTDGDVYNIIDNFTKIVTALQGDGYTLTMTGDAEADRYRHSRFLGRCRYLCSDQRCHLHGIHQGCLVVFLKPTRLCRRIFFSGRGFLLE